MASRPSKPDQVKHSAFTIDRFNLSPGMRVHARAVLVDPRPKVEVVRPLGRSSVAWATGEIVELWVVRMPGGGERVVDPTMLSLSPIREQLDLLRMAWRAWQPRSIYADGQVAESCFRIPAGELAEFQGPKVSEYPKGNAPTRPPG